MLNVEPLKTQLSMRRLLSFVILFLIFQLSYSNIYDPHFQNLTIEDGLPHNTVCTICKDKEGFIWIGTNNGLCRYDGINMKIFKHNVKNPHSINNNYISYIFCDQSGTLWVGTRKGLNRYNNFNESFESISFYDPETNQTNKINSVISCITQTNDSILYIATLGQGLIKYDKHSNQFKSVLLTRSIDNLHVSTITIGKNQEIYLGIESWGLLLFNPVTQKGTLLIDKILEFRCLYYSNNELLIGSMYGMYQYNLLNNKLEEFTPVK